MLEYTPHFINGARRIMLDASSLNKLHCDRAYKYACIDGLYEELQDPILRLGKAVHRYAELRTLGTDEMQAMSSVLKEFPGLDRGQFMGIAAAHMKVDVPKPLVLGDHPPTPMVEWFFEFPWLAGVVNGVTYQIVVCGTFDHVAFDGRVVRIIDYKSSRKWKVEDIMRQYEFNTQRNFYTWVMRKFAFEFLPVNVANAADAGNVTTEICAIQVGSKTPRWVMLPPQHLTQYQFDQFEAELCEIAERILLLHAGDEAYRTGMVNNTCTYCRFTGLCYARGTEEHDIVKSRFIVRKYDPASHSAPANKRLDK